MLVWSATFASERMQKGDEVAMGVGCGTLIHNFPDRLRNLCVQFSVQTARELEEAEGLRSTNCLMGGGQRLRGFNDCSLALLHLDFLWSLPFQSIART